MSRATHKRTAHRWQVGGLIAAGLVFALGSFWLVQVINGGDVATSSDPLKSEPDYIVEKFSFVRMTPAGKPGYIISGDKLTHRPSDDTFDIVAPVVLNIGSEKPPMTMHAKTAHVDQDKNLVDLAGDVDIRRPQQGAMQAMSLKTDALTVFPDEDRMETAQPFQLVIGTTNLAGVGMKANNATGRLDVHNRVQLNFPPRAR
ncbi:LPS export ABC transporter periplasmic protein LptC [Massilia sp. R2A-15]|uniref:LPS export ABC transporter periplasmic protein LptC n=1 Tax=Massilia sp. R2A-15 TaxID=3064278 RepID=UPI0027363419|nr:LPS export ABC transporter periplasmic protein LptC [Massilia sp. R2A-15]WLI89514.1 LPS export ABC transporter periplasmic protein LptC [Massilia sp. R2A-15]